MERLKNCEKADSMLQILLHNQIPITGHFFLERFPVTTCNESRNAEAKESSSRDFGVIVQLYHVETLFEALDALIFIAPSVSSCIFLRS